MSADRAQGRAGRWLAIAASVVVVATVAVAIVVMDSPSAQREAKLDSRRVDDLVHIVRGIDNYVKAHGTLPPDLATLAGEPGQRLSITDPVDGTPYGYEATGERSFRLCAGFATDTARTPAAGVRWSADEWNHDVGPQCFDRKVKRKPD